MRSLTPGHRYALANFESERIEGRGNDNVVHQTIQFLHREAINSAGDSITKADGTTNEEVLEALIDRMNFLNQKLPSRESAIVITKLEEALLWLNRRTANRKARGVEGTYNK